VAQEAVLPEEEEDLAEAVPVEEEEVGAFFFLYSFKISNSHAFLISLLFF